MPWNSGAALRARACTRAREIIEEFSLGSIASPVKTDHELNEWLASPEGKAATLFDLTSGSGWGERARS
jgi:hypothetical protein